MVRAAQPAVPTRPATSTATAKATSAQAARVPTCADGVQNNAETDIDCGGGGALNCAACADGKKCADSDSNCGANSYCDLAAMPDHLCAPKKANGGACTGMNQCTSGTCTDGVCCNMACGGLCEACNVAGSVGTCSAVPSNTDPANECMDTQVCNGNKECRKINGETCAGATDCLTDNCIDSVCCNSTCSGTCLACNVAGSLGTCSSVPAGTDPAMECAGALNCNGVSPTPACQKADGQSCTVGAECGSGNCIDGVCCNTACGTQCEACNLAGSLGTCTPVPAGSDPAGECSAGTPDCNGNKACGKGPGGVACVPGAMNVCVGNVNCPAGGVCVVATGELCIPNAMGACSDGMGGAVACPAGGTCP
ncbi:MAG: hypothetical protein IPK82_08580 [Polyangiaceae bacterium]|nr:hypothetical protein [Polyangiaceae bacterium]